MRRVTLTGLITCSLALLGAASAYAAEPTPTAPAEQPIETIPVVVTGTRGETAKKDSPVAVDVIDREEIEASGATTAADVLEGTLGIAVRPSFRGSGIEVQGLSTKHVLVLVDGQRVTGKSDEELDLSRFSADSIERIEIVKGAASALYGSDAIGGVIQIFTRRPPKSKTEGHVEILAGENGRAVLDGRMGVGGKYLSGVLSFGLHRDEPFRLDPSTPATTGSGATDVGTTLRLDWRPSKKTRVDLRVAHLYRELYALDAVTLPPDLEGNPRFRRVDRVDYLHTLDARIAPRTRFGRHSLEFALATSQVWSTLLQDQRNGTQYDRRQVSSEQLYQAEAKWTFVANDHHTLTVGIDGIFERLVSERLTIPTPDRGRVALYAQDAWLVLEQPKLTLVPGFRVDVDTEFGEAFAPRLAVRWDPKEQVALRLGGGLGFRAPGFREMYLFFENPSVGYRVEGNPDLEPEHSVSVDASVEWSPDIKTTKRWTLSLGVFRHDVDDLIVTDLVEDNPTGVDIYSYVNIASATSQGVEASVAVKPLKKLEVKLGYGFTDSRDNATDLKIPGRATHQATLAVTGKVELLDVGVRAELVGPRPFERFSSDANGDVVVTRYDSDMALLVDARLGVRVGDNITFVAGCDNLADTGDFETLPIRPRTFYAGLRGTL